MADTAGGEPRRENEPIEEQVEDQVKAEMATEAGVDTGESWEETARRIETRIRAEMAGWLGVRREATWGEVGQGIERHTKEAFGGWAGATASDDWETVGRKIEARIRQEAARRSGVEPAQEADWEAVARRVDSRMRAGLGRWVGAEPDADWRALAGRYRARIDAELHQRFSRPAGPGATSETGAAAPAKEGTMAQTEGGEKIRREEIHVAGSDLIAKVKDLIHQGNVRRVIVKQEDRVIVEFPLTLGVVGALLAPTLAAIGAVAALVAEATIVVERSE